MEAPLKASVHERGAGVTNAALLPAASRIAVQSESGAMRENRSGMRLGERSFGGGVKSVRGGLGGGAVSAEQIERHSETSQTVGHAPLKAYTRGGHKLIAQSNGLMAAQAQNKESARSFLAKISRHESQEMGGRKVGKGETEPGMENGSLWKVRVERERKSPEEGAREGGGQSNKGSNEFKTVELLPRGEMGLRENTPKANSQQQQLGVQLNNQHAWSGGGEMMNQQGFHMDGVGSWRAQQEEVARWHQQQQRWQRDGWIVACVACGGVMTVYSPATSVCQECAVRSARLGWGQWSNALANRGVTYGGGGSPERWAGGSRVGKRGGGEWLRRGHSPSK